MTLSGVPLPRPASSSGQMATQESLCWTTCNDRCVTISSSGYVSQSVFISHLLTRRIRNDKSNLLHFKPTTTCVSCESWLSPRLSHHYQSALLLSLVIKLQPLLLPRHLRAAHSGDGPLLCPDGPPPVQGRQDHPPARPHTARSSTQEQEGQEEGESQYCTPDVSCTVGKCRGSPGSEQNIPAISNF